MPKQSRKGRGNGAHRLVDFRAPFCDSDDTTPGRGDTPTTTTTPSGPPPRPPRAAAAPATLSSAWSRSTLEADALGGRTLCPRSLAAQVGLTGLGWGEPHARASPEAARSRPCVLDLEKRYQQLDRKPLRVSSSWTEYQGYSVFPTVGVPTVERSDESWRLVYDLSEDRNFDFAIGALLGLAIGDAVGHPLEFKDAHIDDTRPCLRGVSKDGQLDYFNPRNEFNLKLGQWTDDLSMALCLGDTLLTREGFDGGDARVRWAMWWRAGCNNAFRYDDDRYDEYYRPNKHSCGLGTNIKESLREVYACEGRWAKDVPPIYTSRKQDAGNGSIMRLAPVPIHFYKWPDLGEKVAELQSKSTHPGEQASLCCIFMTFLIIRRFKATEETAAEFVDATIADFCRKYPLPPGMTPASTQDVGEGKQESMRVLYAVLKSRPPTEKEACWNWREAGDFIERIRISLIERAYYYNGYYVDPGYFGSYCMDGLAMALWAFYHSRNYDDCLKRVVNLLGDADTTGAIAGQMAGVFYGYRGMQSGEIAASALRGLKDWDPDAEIPQRAAMLFHFCPSEEKMKMMKNDVEAVLTKSEEKMKMMKNDVEAVLTNYSWC